MYIVDKCIIKFLCFRDSSEVVTHSADAFAPVAYLRFLELHLEDKASKSKIHSDFKRKLRYRHWFPIYNSIKAGERAKQLILSLVIFFRSSVTKNFANVYNVINVKISI